MSKEETSTHILDTAIDLFWRSSYHGVNMNGLSRAAGVNKATVYQHFSSKENLAQAAVERAAERTRIYVFDVAFDHSKDPVERLKKIYLQVYTSHKTIFETEAKCLGCPFVNMGVELASSSDAIRKLIQKVFLSFQTYYEEIARDYSAGKDDYSSLRKEEVVSALLANMNSCLVASKIERNPDEIMKGLNRAIKILETC